MKVAAIMEFFLPNLLYPYNYSFQMLHFLLQIVTNIKKKKEIALQQQQKKVLAFMSTSVMFTFLSILDFPSVWTRHQRTAFDCCHFAPDVKETSLKPDVYYCYFLPFVASFVTVK